MIHNTHKIYYITLLFISLLISCNDSNFSKGKTKNKKPSPSSLNSQGKSINQDFKVNSSTEKQLPLRMLWLIDNSLSMEDDVSAVQNGIKDFVNSITTSSYEDVNVTFVSCLKLYHYHRSTCLTPSQLNHSAIRTVELGIESYNGLINTAFLLAKEHLWPASMPHQKFMFSKEDRMGIINKMLGLKPSVEEDTKIARNLGEELMHYGSGHLIMRNFDLVSSLKHYFSPNYVNMIISVTDEYATMRAKDFVNFLRLNYGSTQSFRYYGFVSDLHPVAERAIKDTYIKLAKELNGKTYDIRSNQNYSTLFQDLSQEIKKTIAVSYFKLSSSCQEVEHVLVDGVAIDASLYSCADQELNVNQKALENANNVSVKYYKN